MSRTPETLTKQFEIAPEAGQGRAIPTALLAYTGPNKSRFLTTIIPMIMKSALPEYGEKATFFREVTQKDLAQCIGLSREAYTRRLSEIATPDDYWSVDRRLTKRDIARKIHSRRGHRLHDKDRPARCHVETLIARRRRFMKPNRYALAFPGRRDDKRPDEWFPPTMKEAQENELLKQYFGRLLEGEKMFRQNFKRIPQWLWDPKLPVSWKARLVMSYYFMCGLGSKNKHKKIIGEVHPEQRKVSSMVGISVRSVYSANLELAAIGLIRVAHKRIKLKDGSLRNTSQIIVYLPIRQLSEEEANEERTRLKLMLDCARMTSGEQKPGWMLPRVKELHEALLKAWTGQEHSMRVFWKRVRENAIAEGVHLSVIERLIPNPPN